MVFNHVHAVGQSSSEKEGSNKICSLNETFCVREMLITEHRPSKVPGPGIAVDLAQEIDCESRPSKPCVRSLASITKAIIISYIHALDGLAILSPTDALPEADCPGL
jgi:hypothetical protein